jgi:hypothetical protein
LLVAIFALVLEGCWLRRSPAPPPVSVTNPRQFSIPARPKDTPDPLFDLPVDSVGTLSAAVLPDVPDVAFPGPPRRRGEGVAQKKPAAPKLQPVPAPATVPRLGEILSPEIRANYERDFIAHVARAQDVINQAAGRNLDSIQEQTVERIRTFLSQAFDLRDRSDLSNGVEIARRASLLAEDLVRTFR